MRISRQAVMAARTCAVCERTLLVGEQAVRYSPDEGESFLDVCPLCQEIALEHGWLKEGSPTSPVVPDTRRRRLGALGALFEPRKQAPEPVVEEPILRRLSRPERAMVEAAELFNESAFRRTVAGIAKSLGQPRASIVPLPGVNTEVVLTVAWDISWYQYRIAAESGQPVRLEERGHDPRELEPKFKSWNARLTPDGRIVPDISPV
jgi:hypothetical protein